jgi:short-subunit dehydrogenase
MEFTGKNILITGASSGIGLELAKRIAAEKCNLALLNRRVEITGELAKTLSIDDSKVISVKCDVSNRDEVIKAIDGVKNNFGKIDIAILNSGVSIHSPVENFNSENAKQMFDVNVTGMMHCIDALLPEFINNKSGVIVGISSLADGRGFPRSGVYCASKAAVTIFLESIRVELKKYNVRVITVKPGFIRTPMTKKNEFKMPFLMDVDKAAGIILNGIKKEKRIIQFPLPTVIATKLLRIIPNSVFEFIARWT